jgi:hypothetical protein
MTLLPIIILFECYNLYYYMHGSVNVFENTLATFLDTAVPIQCLVLVRPFSCRAAIL